MTLEELKERCIEQGFKYAYGRFKNPTEPPHLVAISTDTDNFMADNKVYKKILPIKLDYTYIDKNIKEISNNNTMGILICKRENKFVIEYCSDERIAVREYELV